MGIEVMYRHICDVCSAHVMDEVFKAYPSPFGPIEIPPPQSRKIFGGRVLCERCYSVLENVAVAIAPGVTNTTAQAAQTAAPVQSSSAVSPKAV
jgi:hypothetical protein